MAKLSKKAKRTIIDMVIIAVVAYLFGMIVDILISTKGGFDIKAIDPFNYWGPIIVLVLEMLYLLKFAGKRGGGGGDDKKKKPEEQQYYKGKLWTDKELKENYIFCNYSDVKSKDFAKEGSRKGKGQKYNSAGILVKNEYNKAKTNASQCFLPPIHTMIIGNTNSGKSQAFILPTIQTYAEMKTKPSMIISDLKGELFQLCNDKLVKSGYNVVTLNLRDPFRSDRWNPLERSWDNYQRAMSLKKEVYIHRAGTPKENNLKFDPSAVFGSSWFEFSGFAFASEQELEIALEGEKQKLCQMVSEDISDIMNVIVQTRDEKSAMWDQGARQFAQAILLAMLEDSQIPELGMTKEKYNFYNFYKIASIKDGGDDPYGTLKKYFQNRSKIFNIQELANAVVNAGENTASSFISTLMPAIGLFADPGIAYLTSGTDIDFKSFTDKPTAFFIRIPDEKETMHKIATIAIEQLYKTLVDLSNHTINLRLDRPTFFILDEFANLPKIANMATYVAVSRSRWIYFLLVVQDYAQLESKYERSGATTIKNNCNIHIFIGSGDPGTLKEVSERAGKTTVTVEDKSESKGEKDSKNTTTSKKEHERDLVFVDDLRQLEPEKMLVLYEKTPAFFTKMQFYYRSQGCFNMTKTPDAYRASKYLDESKVYYSVQGYLDYNRNKNKAGGGGNRFDDFNFDF